MIKLIAIGRLTKDVDLQDVGKDDSKIQVGNFVLACRDNKETEFISCTAWNEVAITIAKHCKKGSLVYIEGRHKTKNWVDEKTQVQHKRIFINVEKFEFLSPKEKEVTLPLE